MLCLMAEVTDMGGKRGGEGRRRSARRDLVAKTSAGAPRGRAAVALPREILWAVVGLTLPNDSPAQGVMWRCCGGGVAVSGR